MILVLLPLFLSLLAAPYFCGVPDESMYSSWICALIFLSLLFSMRKSVFCEAGFSGASLGSHSWTNRALLGLMLVALLSLVLRVVDDQSIAYLGPMIRGLLLLGSYLTLYFLTSRLSRSNFSAAFGLILCIFLAAALTAEIGINEYLAHRAVGQSDWRVFATSTPDFLAGYLAMQIPLSLSLFIGLPWNNIKQPMISRMLALLTLIVLGMQAVTLLRTQSRFALVSLAAGLLVFLLTMLLAQRAGMAWERSSKIRLGAIGAAMLVFAARFAQPVIARLHHTSSTDNSTAFRLYTWRGAIRMALHNPALGTGIGTWVHLYPRYAITGFTRLAHDSYLQMADECGFLGLFLLLAALVALFYGILKYLRIARSSEEIMPTLSQWLEYLAPNDKRILLCGLAGALSAGCIQNVIDSDWYVVFIGFTFWAMAGVASGLSEESPRLKAVKAKPIVLAAIGGAALLGLLDMAAQGMAAFDAQQGATALASSSPSSSENAEQEYGNAAEWNPLEASYPSALGYSVFLEREGRVKDALHSLRLATRLDPSSIYYSQLAAAYDAERNYPAAIAALQQGLIADPISVDLRLTLAQMLPPPQSIAYYQQIIELQKSPVGRVRALGNLVDYRFAIADSQVADFQAISGCSYEAMELYVYAEKILEQYADEGGTNDMMRQALMGDHPSPALDAQMQTLYNHVMSQEIKFSPPETQKLLRRKWERYQKIFSAVFAESSNPGSV